MPGGCVEVNVVEKLDTVLKRVVGKIYSNFRNQFDLETL